MIKNKLVLGITTAPRKNITLHTTVKYLKSSGWEHIHLFAEPYSDYCENQFYDISRRKRIYGAWRNWFFALKEMYEQYDQDWYPIVQDDIITCKNTYSYINSLVEYPDDVGCISLFTPDMYLGDKRWNSVEDNSGLWMAQFLCFPKESVKSILENEEVWKIGGTNKIDIRIGAWAYYASKKIYYHAPSLVQHIGDTSAIWNNSTLNGQRIANSYAGDDFDCLSLIKKAT